MSGHLQFSIWYLIFQCQVFYQAIHMYLHKVPSWFHARQWEPWVYKRLYNCLCLLRTSYVPDLIKCCACILSFNLPNNLVKKEFLLLPLSSWVNWGLKNILSQITWPNDMELVLESKSIRLKDSKICIKFYRHVDVHAHTHTYTASYELQYEHY